MKRFTLMLAGLTLCVSQAVFAATPEQEQALGNALSQVMAHPESTAAAEAFIVAAANAGISADLAISQLSSLGVQTSVIGAAVAHVAPSLPATYTQGLNTSVTLLATSIETH